jgi:hypothetical protein
MRETLKKFNGKRTRFQGTFVRFGTKNGWQGSAERTILLKDVKHVLSGIIVCDHVWFTLRKRFSEVEPKEGDVLEFDARVTEYLKGYRGRRAEETGEAYSERDYKLSNPTKIKKSEVNNTETLTD